MVAKAVDLFCGAGGLTRGLKDAGINVVAGFDLDDTCRFAYEHNNRPASFNQCDISNVSAESINKFYDGADIKILAGCAPCQPFSSYTRKDRSGSNNEKWGLLKQFARIVEEVSPEIVSMENVPQLAGTEPFDVFQDALKSSGYHVSYSVVNCIEYEIPQRRRRLVLLASKFGEIKLTSPTSKKGLTVRDKISNLDVISAGEISKHDKLHRSQKLIEINKKRIIASVPGGTWEDWPEDIQLECHKKKSGQSYKSVYGRMKWDEPSPTITTEFFNYGSGRFGHPDQNRALSLREGALLQTFPANYEFVPGNDCTSIANTAIHIGNAVPVKLGEAIGVSIINHIRDCHGGCFEL